MTKGITIIIWFNDLIAVSDSSICFSPAELIPCCTPTFLGSIFLLDHTITKPKTLWLGKNCLSRSRISHRKITIIVFILEEFILGESSYENRRIVCYLINGESILRMILKSMMMI